MENAIKWLALSLLPQPLLYRLWHLRRRKKPRTADANTSKHTVIPIQDDARLEVYWTETRMGRGPCVSLFVMLEEVLRIDCLGDTVGHMHVNPIQLSLLVGWKTTPRQFFPPASRESQIDRAVFEMTTNSPFALQTNHLARVRQFSIAKKSLEDATEQMKNIMNDLVADHESDS